MPGWSRLDATTSEVRVNERFMASAFRKMGDALTAKKRAKRDCGLGWPTDVAKSRLFRPEAVQKCEGSLADAVYLELCADVVPSAPRDLRFSGPRADDPHRD